MRLPQSVLNSEEWRVWSQNRRMEWEMEKERERMMQSARAKRGELTAEDQSVGTTWAEPLDHRLGHTEQKSHGWFARFIEWVGR